MPKYKITADTYNFVISKQVKHKNKKTGEITYKWVGDQFFPDVLSLVFALRDMKIRQFIQQEVPLLEAIKQGNETIINLLTAGDDELEIAAVKTLVDPKDYPE